MLGTPKPLCIIYYILYIIYYDLHITFYELRITPYSLSFNPALAAFPEVFFIYVLRTETLLEKPKITATEIGG